MEILDLNIQKELDLHLFRIPSTHEYNNLAQYELQTRTYHGASSNFKFSGFLTLLKKTM